MWESILSFLQKLSLQNRISVVGSKRYVETGYLSMKNLIGLFEAVCETYDRIDFKPSPDGSTHCNQAIHAVAQKLGCDDLAGLTADEIVAFLGTSSDWQLIDMSAAQAYANQGSLVIAGLSSTDLKQSHGHVVVIRPGIPCDSGKWGSVPRCLNIGAVDFLARGQSGVLMGMPVGVNEAFIPRPKFWLWSKSL